MEVRPDLAADIQELLWLKSQLTQLRDTITEKENAIGEAMGGKRVEIPGMGVVERNTRSARKTWNHADIQAAIARVALENRLVDPETGEVESVDAAEARLLKECANPAWRTTQLRSIGIDPDEYSEVTYQPGYGLRTDALKVEVDA